MITEADFVYTLFCFFSQALVKNKQITFLASFRFILYLMTPWVQLALKESWGQIPLLITELRGFCAPQAYYLYYIRQEVIASRFSRLTKKRTDLPFPVLFFWLRYLDVCFCRHYLKLPFFTSSKFIPHVFFVKGFDSPGNKIWSFTSLRI